MSLSQPGAAAGQIAIGLLADHPEAIEPLARHFQAQWPKHCGDIEAQMALFRRCANRDCIPLTLVAHRGTELVGSVALLERSVYSHSHLRPWVAALFVAPEVRHGGIAMRLVAAAEQWAGKLGYRAAYIGISAAREPYERRGWEFLAMGRAGEQEVMVLAKSLETGA